MKREGLLCWEIRLLAVQITLIAIVGVGKSAGCRAGDGIVALTGSFSCQARDLICKSLL